MDRQRAHFDTFGFVLRRGLFDPSALSAEFDQAMKDSLIGQAHENTGSAHNRFRYVPMMCERTPVSLGLCVRLLDLAAECLGSAVLPVRAKGVTYLPGPTKWHRDSDHPVRSLGIACYLEPLDAEGGALWVLPGSHRPEFAAAVAAYASHSSDLPGVPLPTAPGDAIVFDEHLYHMSHGGGTRRQWRVDFVADEVAAGDALRTYYANLFSPQWDGGYDVDRFPSYGAHWRTIDPRWNQRLEALGAYRAAQEQEAGARKRQSPTRT
jgi:hypothetical protein